MWVMSPDIIEIIDQKTGEPITNTDIKKGDEVSVIGMKASHEIFRQPEGLEVLGPKHFGFDTNYVPIEELMK
ncbi:DUF917 family protein [Candidatus Thorarchaeota archaeon]|nr:MAG: DUF917 family protein [Candidatus Thorarchaeota archaeon]